ncbi:ankyrin repeat domain-containing protein [Aquimarina sp. BL5]|uniref:ankyrin repeat domain-containing protein n=1 Tax=Aquimarina sp. BL5 TaxID=1714860 RepID=UPI000E55214C|nr:ankyrin repeat domain-containing protein [Aquimarina sp. BL5]AXT49444.1 ankyrin repeat domain-containing protein [Aquimarina sp. BL5]RKM98421.1 ankyrin repeat domain-containing protein [Aquimarina sp. BL5]
MSLLKNIYSSTNPEKNIGTKLYRALYESNKDKLVELIETYNIDINKFVAFSNSDSILINATDCSSESRNSKEQIDIINYLIDSNVNINWKNKYGYSALHIALEYHDLSKIALVLIKSGRIEINEAEEKNGNSPIFTAIREYNKTWREEQKALNQLRLEIIEELLKLGANLDQVNNHGISSRRWIQISEDEKLHSLIKKYDKK